MNQMMTAMNQRTGKRITNLMNQISRYCNTSKHPHRVVIQGVQVQLPLLKHHTAPVHPMSPRKKKNRMSHINRQNNSKQTHGGHWHLTLGTAECATIQSVPEERRAMKHDTSMTAPVHLAFSCCFSQKLSLCWWWRLTNTITITWHTWQWALSSTWCDWTWNISLPGNNNTNGTLHMRPTDRLLGHNGSVLHAFLQQHNKMRQDTYTSFASYTSQTTEMKLTRQTKMTDCGKYGSPYTPQP
jgi:hypothetical protein